MVDAGGVSLSHTPSVGSLFSRRQIQEYGGYITDITRVWPISGTFTAAQKDLYNAVLATQRHCISLCRANASVSLDGLHEIAEAKLTDQLKQLGFDMSGKVRRYLSEIYYIPGLTPHLCPSGSGCPLSPPPQPLHRSRCP